MAPSRDVWQKQAAQWTRIGSPLRPCGEDIERLAGIVAPFLQRPVRALILGVTPEMTQLPWAAGTTLLATDCSYPMIRSVWPKSSDRQVVCANWMSFPLPDSSHETVVSDGCFGVTRYPEEHRRLLQNVRRLLRSGGIFAFRVFVRTEHETAANVYEEAMQGRIGTFHAFKLRLLMAYQRDSASGVRVANVWRGFQRDGPGAGNLSRATGWPVEVVDTIHAYRDQDSIYTFPALAEVRQLASEAGLQEVAAVWKTYELGERCPTLAFVRGA